MDNSEPAFPRTAAPGSLSQDGMTLRQWYAGMVLPIALNGINEEPRIKEQGWNENDIAVFCVCVADAIIKKLGEK